MNTMMNQSQSQMVRGHRAERQWSWPPALSISIGIVIAVTLATLLTTIGPDSSDAQQIISASGQLINDESKNVSKAFLIKGKVRSME